MKILIIGAHGNLGEQLVRSLSEGNELITWGRQEADLLASQTVSAKIGALKPQVIINAAAYNAVDKCEAEPDRQLAYQINGYAVGDLAKAALACQALLVHYSTDYVFSGSKGAPYSENDKTDPVSEYGQSKLLGEQKIQKYDNLKYYIVRTSRLFGPRGASDNSKPSFFEAILERAKTQDSLEIVADEIGNFTYTPDLAEATKELIASQKPSGIYHIVNAHPASWHDAAAELFKQQGIAKEIKPVSGLAFARPAKRPANSSLISIRWPLLRDYREVLSDFFKNN